MIDAKDFQEVSVISPVAPRAAQSDVGEIVLAPVDQVKFNPWRGRLEDDQAGIQELAADIAANFLIGNLKALSAMRFRFSSCPKGCSS